MSENKHNLDRLKHATEWQLEIGKVLQSFDPVLRPLEDMAKHGITMATILLGISASIVSIFASGAWKFTYIDFLLHTSWIALMGSVVAGSIQLYRIAMFRETVRDFCHILLGKDATASDRESAMNVMTTPQKKMLIVEYSFLGAGVGLFVLWAIVQLYKT